MPMNMITKKEYCIDYNELYNELMNSPFLDDAKIKSAYLNLWIKQLKDYDKIEVEQFKDKSILVQIAKEDFEAPEKYMLELIYKSQRVNIFFRVSRVLQLIEPTKNNMIEYIPIEDFIKSNSYIKWDKTDTFNIKSDPIILVPITLGVYTKFVVIDGNHRLSVWINEKKQRIPCNILDGQALIDNNMFCSGFSKLMYIFQNELVSLGTYTKRDKITSELLMNKIYFKTGKMLYDV